MECNLADFNLPDGGTIDVIFILRSMQEEYNAIKKVVYVFCGPRESS